MRGLFGAIAAGLERKTTDASNLTWQALLGTPLSKTGVSVNLSNALRETTVLANARVIADGIAQMPKKLYAEDDAGSKVPARTHPLYRVIARRPNSWMTSFEFFEGLTMHAVLTGGGYAHIGRLGSGSDQRVAELTPIVPSLVTIGQDRFGVVSYEIRDKDGPIAVLPRERILHIRGPSWDGIRGLDIVSQAREAIGLSIAAEASQASLHANGGRPGGVLSFEDDLSPEARERIKAAWQQVKEGATAVLDRAAKWQSIAMSGVDAQHLETRKHQIEEICRAMRVFPQMIGHTDKTATFASAEAFFTAHVVHTLMPWVTRWEQAIERDCLNNENGLVVKFSVSGLMRGSLKDQADYFAKSLGAGGSPAWHSQDEVRELLEYNRMGGAASRLPQATNVAPAATGDEGDEDE